MRYRTLVTRILVAFVVALSGVAAAYWYTNTFVEAWPDLATMSFQDQKAYWSERIRMVGDDAAYKELGDAIQGFDPLDKHFEAHIFGSVLFSEKGLSGITVCDGSFLYGCAHAFVMQAIKTLGIEAITELNDACMQRFRGEARECQHGIGHGILGTLDDGEDPLKTALALCDKVDLATAPYRACAGGVFMEYNLHWSKGLKSPAREELRQGDLMEPCDAVALKYAPSCAYWQPSWWTSTSLKDADPSEQARTMGRLCQQISKDSVVRLYCLRGITYLMPVLSDERPAQSGHFCALAANSSAEQYYCQKFSAVRFMRYWPLQESLRACEGLPDTEESDCKKEALEDTEVWRREQDSRSRMP